jgi:hypothetical protein
MKRYGNWQLIPSGERLVHVKTGCIVVLAQVRSLDEIAAAMEEPSEWALHSMKDMVHLAGALIEILGGREKGRRDELASMG